MTVDVTLGELATAGALVIGDGYRTRRNEHGQPGYRILRVADVVDGYIRLDGEDFVSKAMRPQIGGKLSQTGDVLLTTKGTVGRVAIVPGLPEPLVYSPQLCFFRVVDNEVLTSRFLAYWFKSANFSIQASHRMNNTDMAAYINLADIRSLRLSLPPVREQRGIAEVLGALDDKIAANTALASTADALLTLHLGRMTKGAPEMPLSQVAHFVNGKAFTKGASGTGRVVIRIAELNSGLGGSTVFSDIDVADQYLARPGDVLFAWSGSLTLSRWFRAEGIINQHIFKVIPRPGYPTWFVHGLIARLLPYFKSVAADKATTMGHIQRHHLDVLGPVPDDAMITDSNALMTALWDRALNAERESLQLAELRDVLLPELMSGRIRVRDAEKAVGDVV